MHLSIFAWVHGKNTGELPHATSCVFILHKDNIIDGQVPVRSRPLLGLLQAEEELFLPTRPEFVGQVLYSSPTLTCIYVSWLEGSRGASSTLDFMVNRWLGVSGAGESGSASYFTHQCPKGLVVELASIAC